MVATDCLSEGVNLQEHFTAVIHYDLPWNPNRLEQREGRIDRYGQTALQVDCILLYGNNNPVDGAVLDVLLRKAVTIHRSLGITVPVPMDSVSVQSAIFQSLFERVQTAKQLNIFDQLTQDNDPLLEINTSWDKAVEREKVNRTRFAQRAIKPEEVKTELEESDRVLGNEQDIEQFVKAACARYGSPLIAKRAGWLLSQIPSFLQGTLGDKPRLLSFTSPVTPGSEYVGRNHPLVEGLARYLLEATLNEQTVAQGGRCSLVVTAAVTKPTTLLLLRVRYLLQGRKAGDLLAEECLLRAFTGTPMNPQWLTPEATEALAKNLSVTGDCPVEKAQRQVQGALSLLPQLMSHLSAIAEEQAEKLDQCHRRVRSITQEGLVTVKPQLPMDILGFYLLQPPQTE
jgi:hypothetical protein